MVIIILGLLALAVAAALIAKKISENKQLVKSENKILNFPHQHRNFESEINLLKRMIPAVQSYRAARTKKPAIKEINILDGRSDITQSLLALVEKYSLGAFTIATTDGLVFASSGGDDASTDAATCRVIASGESCPKPPFVLIPGLTHQGSALIGIIRTQNPVSEEILKNITTDTQKILNWWV
jgi:hypothetical protein